MAVRMKIGGIEVEVDTPEEARKLLLIGNTTGESPGPTTRGAGKTHVSNSGPYHSQLIGNLRQKVASGERILAFLGMLKENAGGPTTSTSIARRLGIGTHGIGGLIAGMLNRLDGSGIDSAAVCGRQVIGGKFYWVAGPKFDEGAEWLRAKVQDEKSKIDRDKAQ